MESGKLCTFFILILGAELAFGCTKKTDQKQEKRIAGGEPATIQGRPYQLLLQKKENGQWKPECGAVILTKEIALTAGYCLENAKKEDLRLISGSMKRGEGAKHNVFQFAVHENFTERPEAGNDIAVILVKEPFVFSDTTKAISIADSEPAVGTKAVYSGWGQTKTNGEWSMSLNKVDVKMAARSVCNEKYKSFGITLGKTMLCAEPGNKGMCRGDHGGPLTANGKLIGIGSVSVNCGDPEHPSVFTNVFELEEWIQTKICVWVHMKANHPNGRGI